MTVQEVALSAYLFPAVGAVLGLIIGLLGSVLTAFLPGLTSAVLVVGGLYFSTGLHHFDGLLDFGDGLMFRGTPQSKVTVMRDKATGAGGLALGLINTLLLVSCLWTVSADNFVPLMLVSETSAKLAMVFAAFTGKPSSDGVGAVFTGSMKGRRGKAALTGAIIFSVVIAVVALRIRGLVGLVSALVVAGSLVMLSHRHFQSVTGDVLGAVNELARSCTLLILVVFRWL